MTGTASLGRASGVVLGFRNGRKITVLGMPAIDIEPWPPGRLRFPRVTITVSDPDFGGARPFRRRSGALGHAPMFAATAQAPYRRTVLRAQLYCCILTAFDKERIEFQAFANAANEIGTITILKRRRRGSVIKKITRRR